VDETLAMPHVSRTPTSSWGVIRYDAASDGRSTAPSCSMMS
jgi:hypothetical protein